MKIIAKDYAESLERLQTMYPHRFYEYIVYCAERGLVPSLLVCRAWCEGIEYSK